MSYIVVLNNSARIYGKQIVKYEIQKETKVKSMIFISHRSTDKDIADMLVDFFSGTGISKNLVFCSSLPGNDINEKISVEVKAALKASLVNIAILSQDYYQSAYCLNEAGILWYEDVPIIPIALPEVNSSNMYGFLNNEYKLRYLDSDTDISYIYDIVSEAVSASHAKVSVVTRENNKLRVKYEEFLKTRKLSQLVSTTSNVADISDISTDDEQIILYYILWKNVRKVSKSVISQWLNESEIYEVNIDNAFDLLASFTGGFVKDDILEFGFEAFRKYSLCGDSILIELKKCVNRHTKLAVNTFKEIWDSGTFEPLMKLFISYIIDERMWSFGARWMADGQIESIKQWERNNMLDSVLSDNYEKCLGFFIKNDLVYESSWTSYGNPRGYTLCLSLQEFLINCPIEVDKELKKIKDMHNICILSNL